MFLSTILNFNIPIIFTKNEKDTANFLISVAKKQEKEKTNLSLRYSKSLSTKEEQKQFILEGFPGIGPTITKKLFEKFKTLKNIFNSSKKDLNEIKEMNEKLIKKFLDILN